MNDEVKNEENTNEEAAASTETGSTDVSEPETGTSEEQSNDADAEARTELLKSLDGNVKQVTKALKGKTPEQLQVLLQAEQDGKTRSGVVDAINAILNPDAPKEAAPAKPAAKRSVKDIEKDLEEAEAGPTDVTNARVVMRLREELAEAKGKK